MRKLITYKELTTPENGELEALCDSIYKLQGRGEHGDTGWRWSPECTLGCSEETKGSYTKSQIDKNQKQV